MKFHVSLLAKIYLATGVAVTAFFAAAGWFFLYEASGALHSGVEQEVRASLATVDASLESRTEHLATASALLASMSDIKRAFGTRDAETIRDTTLEFWERAEAGYHQAEPAGFVVAGPGGAVLASIAGKTPSAMESGKQVPASVLEPALREFPRQSRAFAQWDGIVWQVLATPLYVDSGNREALLNILLALHPLTDLTLRDLKQRTGGIDFLLRVVGRTTLSTLNPSGVAQVESQPQHFAIHATTLRDGNGQALAELWAIRSFQDVEARVSALSRKMIIAWMIAMTAGLALSYGLARRIVRPVRDLNDAAHELSRENYAVRVPEDSHDELGVLARTFNRMAASIQESRDEQVHSGQIMAVGRLAASIAHDLRNPLSAVVGGSEMLAEFDLKPEDIKQTATNINRAALRMEKLLVEIGQVARARKGEREECRAEDLVRAAVESQEARAAQLGVVIQQRVGDGLRADDFRVRCEKSRVERVLVNLLANALEVMPDGGEISVSVGGDEATVWIEVADTGPGVPVEIRARLFQPFVTAGKKNGFGLGLALARETMLEHGGELELLDSQRGARFRLRLGRVSTPTVASQTPAS